MDLQDALVISCVALSSKTAIRERLFSLGLDVVWQVVFVAAYLELKSGVGFLFWYIIY